MNACTTYVYRNTWRHEVHTGQTGVLVIRVAGHRAGSGNELKTSSG